MAYRQGRDAMRPTSVGNTVTLGLEHEAAARRAAQQHAARRESRHSRGSSYDNMLVSAKHETPGAPGTRSMPWDAGALSPPDASLVAKHQQQQQQPQHFTSRETRRPRRTVLKTRKIGGLTGSTEWPEFASKTQCLYVSFAFFSLPILVVLCFAMIFYLAEPARLDPEYASDCMANREHTREYLCGSFAVLAFLGTVGSLILLVPTTTLLVITVFHKKYFSDLAGQFIAVLLGIIAATLFSLGVILVVRSDRTWAFYTYAYFAVVLGGALGLLVIAVGSFYLGSVLVLTIFTFMGYSEEEVRREFMYGGTAQTLTMLAASTSHGSNSFGDSGDDEDDDNAFRRPSAVGADLEANGALGDKSKMALKIADDADMTDIQAAKRAIKRERHKLDVERRRLEKLDENVRKREQAVREREDDLEELESRLQKRETDLEEAEEEMARQFEQLHGQQA